MRGGLEDLDLGAGLVGVCVVLPAFPVVVFWSARGTNFADPVAAVPLLALIALSVTRIRIPGRDVSRARGSLALLALAASLSVSFVVHASPRSQIVLLSIWGAGAVAFCIARLSAPAFRLVAALVVALGSGEAALAIVQRVLGHGIGLTWLGESPRPFSPGPQGTMIHSYVLVALELLTVATVALFVVNPHSDMFRSKWSVGMAGLASAPIGLTSSRAGALGLVAIGISLIACLRDPVRRRRASIVLVAIVIGAGVPMALWSGVWTSRVSSQQMSDVTTGRLGLVSESVHLLIRHPVTGVGPGRYVEALERDAAQRGRRSSARPVHDVPLLAAVEGGILALAICVWLLVLLGRRAIRAGAATAGLYAALVPYFLLDHLLYNVFQGAIILGLWVGLLDYFCTAPAVADRPAAMTALELDADSRSVML